MPPRRTMRMVWMDSSMMRNNHPHLTTKLPFCSSVKSGREFSLKTLPGRNSPYIAPPSPRPHEIWPSVSRNHTPHARPTRHRNHVHQPHAARRRVGLSPDSTPRKPVACKACIITPRDGLHGRFWGTTTLSSRAPSTTPNNTSPPLLQKNSQTHQFCRSNWINSLPPPVKNPPPNFCMTNYGSLR